VDDVAPIDEWHTSKEDPRRDIRVRDLLRMSSGLDFANLGLNGPESFTKDNKHMRIYFDLVRDTLGELKAAGRLRDVDLTVAAFSVIGMILWLPRWFRQGGRLTDDQAAHEIADFALAGVLKAPAPARRPRRPQKRT